MPVQWITPADLRHDHTLLYFFGGGHITGSPDEDLSITARLAHFMGARVCAPHYRLAPEHPFPAAFEDGWSVLSALGRMHDRIVVAGDSAGGNLAAAAAHARRDPRILGQVLIYPGLGGDRQAGSYVTHANSPMLTAADLEFYGSIRHGGMRPPQGDPTVSPLQDRDFSRLPMTLTIGAECDPLQDDAPAYAAAITAAGGRAHAVTAQGLVHGYLRARAMVPRAAESFDLITATIAAFSEARWPFDQG